MCAGMLSLNLFSASVVPESERYAQVASLLSYTSAVSQADQARQKACDKIERIIVRFNPAMARHLRNEIVNLVYEMSIKYPNIDVDLICATITHESGRTWDPKALSKAGAMGLMQIMPATGKWLAQFEGIEWTNAEEILYDPVLNIRLGTRYLSALVETYDIEGGLAAYNGGSRRARMWLSKNKAPGILWAETRSYIPYVMKLYDEFRALPL